MNSSGNAARDLANAMSLAGHAKFSKYSLNNLRDSARLTKLTPENRC